MKLAALFSGGKDSAYAMYKAMKYHDVSCLITLKSENKDSFMFHTPNIDVTQIQSEKIGIPLILAHTRGDKEEELKDLKKAISKAKKLFKIKGIVTGAIESVYQASRIQRICDELNLWCFNPLWKKDQIRLLKELIENRFETIISAVAAYPFDEKWLGRNIDSEFIKDITFLKNSYKINPAGEGGEYESLVLDAPFFKTPIKIIHAKKSFQDYSGTYQIEEMK